MTHKKLTGTMVTLAAATLVLTAAAGVAQADKPHAKRSGGQWMLQHYDADGDGMITLQEFQAAGDAIFARLDTDGDGRLSADELAAAGRAWGRPGRDDQPREPRSTRRFAHMDADGDGYVTRAEFDAARMARFNALDVNGNGVIDADELPTRGARKGHGKRDRQHKSADES